jgi:uncharacterized membrane protein
MITALAQAANESDPLIGFLAVGGAIVLLTLWRFGARGFLFLAVGVVGILTIGTGRSAAPLTDKQNLGLVFLGLVVGCLGSEASLTPRSQASKTGDAK